MRKMNSKKWCLNINCSIQGRLGSDSVLVPKETWRQIKSWEANDHLLKDNSQCLWADTNICKCQLQNKIELPNARLLNAKEYSIQLILRNQAHQLFFSKQEHRWKRLIAAKMLVLVQPPSFQLQLTKLILEPSRLHRTGQDILMESRHLVINKYTSQSKKERLQVVGCTRSQLVSYEIQQAIKF